jgi:hypothetical protein
MSSKAFGLGEATGVALRGLALKVVDTVRLNVNFDLEQVMLPLENDNDGDDGDGVDVEDDVDAVGLDHDLGRTILYHAPAKIMQEVNVAESLYADADVNVNVDVGAILLLEDNDSIATTTMLDDEAAVVDVLVPSQWRVLSKDTMWTIVMEIQQFPVQYKQWWLKTLTDDPIHVVIETSLILFALWMMLQKYLFGRRSRRVRGKKGSATSASATQQQQLSSKEKEELIQEWIHHYREPLVPAADEGGGYESNAAQCHHDREVIVQRAENQYLYVTQEGEGSSGSGSGSLSDTTTSDNPATVAPQVVVKKVLNMATHDFLGLGSSNSSNSTPRNHDDNDNDTTSTNNDNNNDNALKAASIRTLQRYGCGSCGPRGFYGTLDLHLNLEEKFASILGSPDSIMYSDGASAATSTIAAFCKRGDLIVADAGIYEPLQSGLTLSRATIVTFKHNDMVSGVQ